MPSTTTVRNAVYVILDLLFAAFGRDGLLEHAALILSGDGELRLCEEC